MNRPRIRYHKIHFLFLAAIGLFIAANSYAASFELTGDRRNLYRGSELTVDIVASGITDLGGVAISLIYPAKNIFLTGPGVTTTFFDTRLADLSDEEGVGSVWSAETATPGIIYLTGLFSNSPAADIDPGPVALFSVHFRVSSLATPGRHIIQLSPNNLCNGPAAWGTDNNDNGIFDADANDRKESAPLLYAFVMDSRVGRDAPDMIETQILIDGFDEAPFIEFNVLESEDGGTEPGDGEEIDSDNDGVSDADDGCPADPAKTEPGECGCGVSDSDSDNDGIPDCLDVLISPANGATNTSVSPVFEVGEFPDLESAGPDAAIIWQISRNSAFTDLVFEYTGAAVVTIIQLPDFILDEFTTYFWRISYDTGLGGSLIWESAGEFTTGEDAMTDVNGNGIPDEQDIDDNELLGFLITTGNAEKTLQSGAGGLQYTLVPGEGVGGIDRFKWLEQEHFETSGSWPVNFTDGLLSFRLQTAAIGDTVSVTVGFSTPMPVGSTWWKSTVEQDVYDYSPYALFAGDMISVTLTLTDGGQGDLDGVANGVIVDPGGIIRAAEDPDDDGDQDNQGDGHHGSSGCFIGTCAPSGH